jgi:hypothetical protein
MPIWTAPLWRARRENRNGYIICILQSSDERDMHKIRSHCIMGPVGPTPGHVATCWHTGCHVSMTPHQSKRSTSRRIRQCHMFSTRIQGPTTQANRLQLTHTPGTVIRDHMWVTGRKQSARRGRTRSAKPLDRPNRPCHGSPSSSTWCSVIGPTVDSQVPELFSSW